MTYHTVKGMQAVVCPHGRRAHANCHCQHVYCRDSNNTAGWKPAMPCTVGLLPCHYIFFWTSSGLQGCVVIVACCVSAKSQSHLGCWYFCHESSLPVKVHAGFCWLVCLQESMIFWCKHLICSDTQHAGCLLAQSFVALHGFMTKHLSQGQWLRSKCSMPQSRECKLACVVPVVVNIC